MSYKAIKGQAVIRGPAENDLPAHSCTPHYRYEVNSDPSAVSADVFSPECPIFLKRLKQKQASTPTRLNCCIAYGKSPCEHFIQFKTVEGAEGCIQCTHPDVEDGGEGSCCPPYLCDRETFRAGHKERIAEDASLSTVKFCMEIAKRAGDEGFMGIQSYMVGYADGFRGAVAVYEVSSQQVVMRR